MEESLPLCDDLSTTERTLATIDASTAIKHDGVNSTVNSLLLKSLDRFYHKLFRSIEFTVEFASLFCLLLISRSFLAPAMTTQDF